MLEEEVIEQEEHWISVSDMMAGLMMVFLLISIVFMVNAEIQKRKVQDVALLYQRLKTDLYSDLVEEFSADLPAWGAEILPDLTIRFSRAELMFDRGETELKPEFQQILQDFFPRYLRILLRGEYEPDIAEVRIEGHTSSMWGEASADRAYIMNMGLSQARTRTTLDFLLQLNDIAGHKSWLKAHLTANGLSSSKIMVDENGEEDLVRSRRVEFRVVTDSESKIAEILNETL